jgi:hypothetical protein
MQSDALLKRESILPYWRLLHGAYAADSAIWQLISYVASSVTVPDSNMKNFSKQRLKHFFNLQLLSRVLAQYVVRVVAIRLPPCTHLVKVGPEGAPPHRVQPLVGVLRHKHVQSILLRARAKSRSHVSVPPKLPTRQFTTAYNIFARDIMSHAQSTQPAPACGCILKAKRVGRKLSIGNDRSLVGK